jgi:ABC-2 type transport system ATP-binding protein
LEDYKDQKIKNLSGGQKQKISFIISIINSPKILILDEPVNNLDYIEREKMYIFLNELSKNCIIIISTHLVDEISRFCNHKIIISNGVALIEN